MSANAIRHSYLALDHRVRSDSCETHVGRLGVAWPTRFWLFLASYEGVRSHFFEKFSLIDYLS
jgi:hypothetical protein